jgi:predicted Ser/Thr protein kinase
MSLTWQIVEKQSPKFLNAGCTGAVFSFQVSTKKYVLKKRFVRNRREPCIVNELRFAEAVAAGSPGRFVRLLLHRVRPRTPDDADIVTKRHFLNSKEQQKLETNDSKSKFVYETVYPRIDVYGKDTPKFDNGRLSRWLLDSIVIMRDAGISHNDMHMGNMGYRGDLNKPIIFDFQDSGVLTKLNDHFDVVQLLLTLTYNPTFKNARLKNVKIRPYKEYVRMLYERGVHTIVRNWLGLRTRVPRVFVDYVSWIACPDVAMSCMFEDAPHDVMEPAQFAFDSLDNLRVLICDLVNMDLGHARKMIAKHGRPSHSLLS